MPVTPRRPDRAASVGPMLQAHEPSSQSAEVDAWPFPADELLGAFPRPVGASGRPAPFAWQPADERRLRRWKRQTGGPRD